MEWLNYHHLYYFWTVAREGSISAASRKLRLAQPTVSAQIKELENSLGTALFSRRGSRLALTDTGSHVYRYAREIFTLGRELQESLVGEAERQRTRLVVGVADVLPKLIAARLLEPALTANPLLHLTCLEDRHDRLLAQLALYELDAVLTDTQLGPDATVRGFSHLLGECGVSLFAAPSQAARLRKHFPRSLDGADVLLPIEHTSLRHALTTWFDAHDLHPNIRGEFQDSALLTAFGQAGRGLFAAPSVIEDEILAKHDVALVARLGDVRERFYVITVERKLAHPALRTITEAARDELFRQA